MNELKLAEYLKCDRNYFVQPITENGYKFLKQKKNKWQPSLEDIRSAELTDAIIEERHQYHKRKKERNGNDSQE